MQFESFSAFIHVGYLWYHFKKYYYYTEVLIKIEITWKEESKLEMYFYKVQFYLLYVVISTIIC